MIRWDGDDVTPILIVKVDGLWGPESEVESSWGGNQAKIWFQGHANFILTTLVTGYDLRQWYPQLIWGQGKMGSHLFYDLLIQASERKG